MKIEHPKHERYGTQAYVKDSLTRAIQEEKMQSLKDEFSKR